MKVTMLSLMAAIPLSVGSVPAFAQSPANISQHYLLSSLFRYAEKARV